MKKYEVTIPFNSMPWFTGYVMAENKTAAINMVWASAMDQGWKGAAGKAEAVEVQ